MRFIIKFLDIVTKLPIFNRLGSFISWKSQKADELSIDISIYTFKDQRLLIILINSLN